MNILAKAKALYDICGLDMCQDIAVYAGNGYVHITPDMFVLGKAVDSASEEHPMDQWNVSKPNAWYGHMCVGKAKQFFNFIPYKLPFVGWMRETKKQPIKWYDFDRIIRRKKI
jgi:hypothetical protein